uniref:PHD-type domain-containing protein n=1 Tax=Caenorhabditis tropicalis TaxID=1561998 RepID=A0A1I7UYM8_9PELO
MGKKEQKPTKKRGKMTRIATSFMLFAALRSRRGINVSRSVEFRQVRFQLISEPPSLRSSAPTRRQTRSVYAQLPATSPKKTMPSLQTSPRKKKAEARQRKTLEKPPPILPEEEELSTRMALVVRTDDNEGPSSSSASSSSAGSFTGIPEQTPGKETVERSKKSRRNPNPAAEFYSLVPYRAVYAGEDIDPDKDEPDIANCCRQATISDSWRPEYSAGTQELAHPEALPQMVVIDDEFYLKPKDNYIHAEKLVYCNDQPEYVDLRHFEKVEPKDPVHYEVTAHDAEWIKMTNQNRLLTTGEDYLSVETFCKIIKALEIDAFKNIHNHLLDMLHVVYIRQPDNNEDQECDVCRVSDCDVSDDMVFCDMCNTCVHMLCAGLIDLPDPNFPWKCAKCEYTDNPAQPCALCPALGGSMTYNPTKSQWAHHSCALFIPEIIFENEETRAPITNFEKIAPERYNQLCTICDTRQGACVTCSQPNCEETYHVCCALRAGCTVKIQEVPNDPDHNIIRVTNCHRHSVPRSVLVDDAYRHFKNPWLAKIEEFFYVMTNYEKLADSLHIEEVIVSDVYEFWKQKRMRVGGPLIPHLHDHIQLEPCIYRVAQRQANNLEWVYNKAGISVGNLPACVDLTRNQFFPPAALMVTELRQLYLKRADESIERTCELSKMIEEREEAKRRLATETISEIRATCNGLKAGIQPQELLGILKVSKAEIRRAQSPKVFADFLKKLEAIPSEIPGSPPLKRKLHPKLAKPLEITIPQQKSPLRPRNNGSPLAQKASTSSAGVQNASPAPKRNRIPARKLHF